MIGGLRFLLGCAALLAVSSCDGLTAQKDVSAMSSAQLEAAIAKGGNRTSEKLRLSEIYLLYGSEEQKHMAYEMLFPMAERGVRGAAERLCPLVYLEDYVEAVLPYCIMAANAGSVRAQADVCVGIGFPREDNPNPYCEDPAKEGRAVAYLYYGYQLIGESRFDDAVDWLNKSILDGPIEHRDVAIGVLALEVKDSASNNPYHLDLRDGQTGQIGRVTRYRDIFVAPPPTPTAIKRRSQCLVEFVVTPTGLASEVKIKCGHESLDESMARAVHAWRFEPSVWRSIPVDGSAPVEIAIFERGDTKRVVYFEPRD